MLKKTIAILIAVITIFSICLSTNAMAYDYTRSVSSTIEITSKTAKCTSIVSGISGKTTKIVITQRLQKKSGDSWKIVETWEKTFYSVVTSFSNSKSNLASGTYRTRTIAKVYSGNSYETIKVNSVSKTI